MKTPRRAKFLLCDDIRTDGVGKISLFGLYPEDTIYVLNTGTAPQIPGLQAVLDQIAIVCLLSDGEGTFPTRFELFDPSGMMLTQMPMADTTIVRSASATVALRGAQFPVRRFGRHTCKLVVGKTTFDFHFEVKAGLPPGATLPPGLLVPSGTSPPALPAAKQKANKARSPSKKK